MDEAKLAELLDTLSDDEIFAAADSLQAYVAHRKLNAVPGVQRAPFNFGNFLKNFLKVVQAVLPVVAPLVGLDPKATPAEPA